MSTLVEIGSFVGSLVLAIVAGLSLVRWWFGRDPCVCGCGARDHSDTSHAYCEGWVSHRNAAGRTVWDRCPCRGYRKPGTPEPLTPEEQWHADDAARRSDPLAGLCGIVGHPTHPHGCQDGATP